MGRVHRIVFAACWLAVAGLCHTLPLALPCPLTWDPLCHTLSCPLVQVGYKVMHFNTQHNAFMEAVITDYNAKVNEIW